MKKTRRIIYILLSISLCLALLFSLTSCTKVFKASEIAQEDYAKSVSSTSTSSGNGSHAIDYSLKTAWKTKSNSSEWLLINFGRNVDINAVAIKEKSPVTKVFRIEVMQGDQWLEVYTGEGIGNYRLATFNTINTRQLRLNIDTAIANIAIANISVYNVHDKSNLTKTAFVSAKGYSDMVANDQDKLNDFSYIYDSFVITDAISVDNNGAITYNYDKDALQQLLDNKINRDFHLDIVSNAVSDPINAYKISDTVIDNIIGLFSTYKIDGVNLYWKGIKNTETWRAYNYLIEKLTKSLKTATTYAGHVPIVTITLDTIDIELKVAACQSLDGVYYIGNSSPDIRGVYNDFYNNCYYSLNLLQSVGFEPSKIVFGIPMFGRSIGKEQQANAFSLLDNANMWQNVYSNVPYDGGYQDFYYNSPALVHDKTFYAMAMRLGGVAAIGIENDFAPSLQHSLSSAILKAVASIPAQ